MHVFVGDTANECWKAAQNAFVDQKSCQIQPSRCGDTYELLHSNFVLRNPIQRWVFSRIPAINPAFAIVEVFWILAGSDSANVVNHWNPLLPKFSGRGDAYHGAYGKRIRHHFGLDQLTRAYQVLKNSPESRQVVIQIWDPVEDLPGESGIPAAADIPCNICSLLKLRDNKLYWHQVMRSNDLFRGTPYNFVQFTTIQEIVAGWLGVTPGEFSIFADSLHLYASDFDQMSLDSAVHAPLNSDSLLYDINTSQKAIQTVWNHIDAMALNPMAIETVYSAISERSLPLGYHNLLLIIAADHARRIGHLHAVDAALHACRNDGLKLLWASWLSRWLEK